MNSRCPCPNAVPAGAGGEDDERRLHRLGDPIGFHVLRVVERLEGPVLDAEGNLTYGPRDHHFGVGHTAHLPHGGRLTITPGDRESYTAAGYYLAAYDALDNWLWGQRFPNVDAALVAGGGQLREAQRLDRITRRPYVGEGADGCRRSAQIDREEADILDVADSRRAYLHGSAEAWEAQAQRMAAADAAHTCPRRPEDVRRGGADHGPGPGPQREW